MNRSRLLAAMLVAAAPFVSLGASASSVFNLGDTVTATGTGVGQTYTVTPSLQPANGIVPLGSYTLTGNSFNNSGDVATGADFNAYPAFALGANGTGGPWNFQDDYYFSTTGATIQTAVISGSLSNITNLQMRLIYAAGNTVTPGSPILGPPAGGSVVDSWVTFNLPGGGSFNQTFATAFASGDYILQVRGLATGVSSYGGTMALAPVPLPAAGWLLMSGVGALAGLRRRKLAAAV